MQYLENEVDLCVESWKGISVIEQRGNTKLYNPILAYKKYTCTHMYKMCMFVSIEKYPGAYSVNLIVVTSHSLHKDGGEEAILYSLYCGVWIFL